MKVSSVLCALLCGAGVTGASPLTLRGTTNTPRAPTEKKTVIIQMFQWNWDSVAAECTNFIGPAGYGFVQVSPPQEAITGSSWWTDYQPVSYTLTSKYGDRDQFSSMIKTCNSAGVQVIADTVLNHMSAPGSGTGTAGDSYTSFNYPTVPYTDNGDFHHCNNGNDDNTQNWDNSTDVWDCQLGGLSDLATDTSENVRSKEAAYVNDMISLGVAGLRLDAAKSINPADIANISSRFSSKVYITQEVIWGANEAVDPSMYVDNGDVMEFRYTTALQTAFTNSGISNLQNLDDQGWIAGDVANVFVADHDTERSGASLTYSSSDNTYTTAHIFSLAHPYGTPTVLSSYEFSGYDDGAPDSNAGACSGNGGTDGWLCQHRWIAISGMVGFRNNAGSEDLTDWVSPSSQQIAFGRGSTGFVAINNEDSDWSNTFSTSLAAGSYCDVISGTASSGSCSSTAITVGSDGTFTATVPSRSAIAIHTGATGSSSAATIIFEVDATTTFGENIYLTGSLSQLGNWDTSNGILLSSSDYPTWKTTVSLPAGTAFEYKYFRLESDGTVEWEDDPNRSDTTPAAGATQTLDDTWK